MNILSVARFLLIGVSVAACTAPTKTETSIEANGKPELLRFAEANCLFWYFKKKNYDLDDIRAISGGIVEMGTFGADKYQQVSMLVRNYNPDIKTKQNIDKDLHKCFFMETDQRFLVELDRIKNSKLPLNGFE